MDEVVWQRLLDRFGQSVTLVQGEQRLSCKAFFQPVRAAEPGAVNTVLGEAPEGKYLYLGPPRPDPEGMDGLEWNSRRYHFIRTRPMLCGDRILYQWAIAREDDRGQGL